MVKLTKKERITRQARGQEIDRIPALGGWINGVRNLAVLGGISTEEYLRDPVAGVVKANKGLDVDGMINPVVPQSLDQIRSGSVEESHFAGIEPEALIEKANSYPDSEKEIIKSFDRNYWENFYRNFFQTAFRTWEGIEPVPNFWEIGGPFPLYTEFGYSAFLMACALYPESVGKIWWAKSVTARQQAEILVKIYREFNLVPLMFCGEDICNNQGPMLSPEFLRQYYFPHVKMIIEPLVAEGVRFVHHCDGYIHPIIDDFISIGFSGFQGFQYELGVDPYELKKKRSLLGEEVLFFTGLSVTRTLPFGTPENVKKEIDYFCDFTDGGRNMFLFSSNVMGVEVPVENIRTAYSYLRTINPGRKSPAPLMKWPESGIHNK